jgi:hypothetical protein
MSVASGPCSPANAGGSYHSFQYSAPGLRQIDKPASDCSAAPASFNRPFAGNLFQGAYSVNHLMQSEPLAVFHLKNFETWGFEPSIDGPSTVSGPGRKTITTVGGGRSASCAINLAAIDGSGHLRPRWATLNALAGNIQFKGTNQNLLNKTLGEITEISSEGEDATENTADDILTFYNKNVAGSEYRLPSSLLSSNRYSNKTKIGRLMVSNSSPKTSA